MRRHRTLWFVAATLLLLMFGIAACVPSGAEPAADVEEEAMMSMEPAE